MGGQTEKPLLISKYRLRNGGRHVVTNVNIALEYSAAQAPLIFTSAKQSCIFLYFAQGRRDLRQNIHFAVH